METVLEGWHQNAQLDWHVLRSRYDQRCYRWMLDATSIDAASIGNICGDAGHCH